MSLSSMASRDTMTPVESPHNSGDLQYRTKKSTGKPDILEGNPIAARQDLLNAMFSLHETSGHVSSQIERRNSQTKHESLPLTSNGVSRGLLNAMFNLRQPTDLLSSRQDGDRRKSETHSDCSIIGNSISVSSQESDSTLVNNSAGEVSQELQSAVHFHHEKEDYESMQVEKKKKKKHQQPDLSKVKKDVTKQISPYNDSKLDVGVAHGENILDFQSNEDVSIYISDTCETESATGESRQDTHCHESTGRNNKTSEIDTDEYHSDEVSVPSESVRKGDIQNGFFDDRINIDASDNTPGVNIIEITDAYDHKEMCAVGANCNPDLIPDRFRKPQNGPLSKEGFLDVTLGGVTRPRGTDNMRAHSAPPGVKNDRNINNASVQGIENDKYSNQKLDKQNSNTVSNSNSTDLSNDSNKKSFFHLLEAFTATPSPNSEYEVGEFGRDDFQNTDDTSGRRWLNTENAIAGNDSPRKVNISGHGKPIVMHAHANIQTGTLSQQQTTVIDTIVNNEANCGFVAEKSKPLFPDSQQVEVALGGFNSNRSAGAQNGTIRDINQRQVDQTHGTQINISSGVFKKNNFPSSKMERTTNEPVVTKMGKTLSQLKFDELIQPGDQTSNMRRHVHISSNYTANKKLQLLGNWKRNHSSHKLPYRDTNMMEDKTCTHKHESGYPLIDSLQPSFQNMSKVKKDSAVAGQYLTSGKAIDRLLVGPYAEKRQICSYPVSKQNRNISKANKVKGFGKRKYQHITLTTDSQPNDGNHEKYSHDKTITRQPISFISQDDWSVINGHAKRKAVHNVSVDDDEKSSMWRQKLGVTKIVEETSNEAEMTFSRPDEKGQCKDMLSTDGARDFQREAQFSTDEARDSQPVPLSPRCQDNTLREIVNDPSMNVSCTNTVGLEKTQMEEVAAPIEDASEGNKTHSVAESGNQQKPGLLFVNSIFKDGEERDKHDQRLNIIEADNISVPLNTTPTVNKLIATSQESTEKVKGDAKLVIPSYRGSKEGESCQILPTSSRDVDAAVGFAMKKPTGLASQESSRAPRATVAFVEETSLSKTHVKSAENPAAHVKSQDKLKLPNNEQYTFTPLTRSASRNSSSLSRNIAASFVKFESAGSKIPRDDGQISAAKKQATTQSPRNHASKDGSPLNENRSDVSRNSPHPSLDSVSRKSVDFSIQNATLAIQPHAGGGHKTATERKESFIHKAIPYLPIPLAVLCLILNILLPGSGTAVSGFLTLCCGQPRVPKKDDQVLTSMCVNFMVGLAQLCTVTFLLIGWLWSITWGIQMVRLSVQRRKELKEQKATKLQTFAMSAFEAAHK